MKMSLIVFGALAVSFLLRRRSAALRHWVLAAGVACAAAMPILTRLCRRGRFRSRTPTAFTAYEDPFRASPSPGIAADRARAATPRRLPRRRERRRPPSPRLDLWATLQSIWLAGTIVGLAILLTGVLRLAWLAAHARRVTHGRWFDLARGDFTRLRAAASGHAAAERSSVAARHVGARASEGDSAGGRRRVDRRARARRPIARAGAHPPRRLDCAALCRAAARILLVQSAALDCLPAAAARERARVRRRGHEPGRRGHRLRHPSHRSGARAQPAPHLWFPAPAMARPSSLERRVRAMLNDRLDRGPISGARARRSS